MNNIINNFTIGDCIQIFILVALVWYSIETRQLRKWQKRQAQLTILELDMKRVETVATQRFNPAPYGEDFPMIIRKIYELGKFNPKTLYSRGFHKPLTFFAKTLEWIKKLFKKINK